MSEGVPIRGKTIPVLNTNPDRLDGEQSTRIRIKNIPLSVDDGLITRVLTLRNIDVITCQREKLRINGKLTNCSTGDRLVYVKSSTLSEPLSHTMYFGQFVGRVIHPGQVNTRGDKVAMKCTKCHGDGHRFSQCPNEWRCNGCNQSGHKHTECPLIHTTTTDENPGDNPDTSDNSDQSDTEDTGSMDTTPVPTSPESPKQTTKRRQARAKTKQSRSPRGSGQQTMEKFVTKTTPNNDTPCKSRASSVTDRSPPTPVDVLHERTKGGNTSKKHSK